MNTKECIVIEVSDLYVDKGAKNPLAIAIVWEVGSIILQFMTGVSRGGGLMVTHDEFKVKPLGCRRVTALSGFVL